MPAYFESLNRDFRCQLTILGHQFAQAVVDSKIVNGSFTIKTDKPNIEESHRPNLPRRKRVAEVVAGTR